MITSNLFSTSPAVGKIGESQSTLEIPAWYSVMSTVGVAAGAYHGYKRDNSIGWAIGWAVLGGLVPFITIPVAIAQGFGKRKRP